VAEVGTAPIALAPVGKRGADVTFCIAGDPTESPTATSGRTATNAAATTTITVIRATDDRAPRHPVNADEPGRSASLFPLIMVIPPLGPAPHRSLTGPGPIAAWGPVYTMTGNNETVLA
jgi:hypothetical protein